MRKTIKALTLLVITMPVIATAEKFPELGKTPPMGWNSWNKYHCEGINETIIRKQADAMVSSGMKEAGYEYIVIDDCWQNGRDEDGRILADKSKFPSGIKALADYVHSKGLKFGLYSDAGTKTCAGRPGSRGYEFMDAKTYAEWGVDFLKYDWCHHGKQLAEPSYTTMSQALEKAGRPILFSLCEWGESEPWTWAQNVGHMWRTTGDIINCFDCVNNGWGFGVLSILDQQRNIRKFVRPGQWNDMDMLEVGNGVLTYEENKTHFSMWSMLASPLITGNDLSNMDEKTRAILTNKNIIALNQDPLGIAAIPWRDYGDFEVWFKPLHNGDYALAFMNRSKEPYSLSWDFTGLNVFDVDDPNGWKSYTFDHPFIMQDLWSNKIIGKTGDTVKRVLKPRETLVIRLIKQ
ncbi:alpha-galactosidase [Saccharobesus litoralis]|uniref:Alpha-galactosidase n=1 Tax=Saccharobesus litoralis TaxID=2172099 RepID=A0A2S0VN79_9ALTE|nr:glycoside hydrolase family 27 protein [Saccharobesus litoralis]AWB65540.1 alpha-galactosidase [Saccharobesus litoralis]